MSAEIAFMVVLPFLLIGVAFVMIVAVRQVNRMFPPDARGTEQDRGYPADGS